VLQVGGCSGSRCLNRYTWKKYTYNIFAFRGWYTTYWIW